MRDCIFLLADSNMEAAFRGFFARDALPERLGTGPFRFDPREDLVVAAGDNDPGLYTRGHELLRPYQRTHRHAIVAIDAAWDGTPGAAAIRNDLTAHISGTGWPDGSFKVIVIDPELEAWIWQKNPHVARAFGFNGEQAMLAVSEVQTAWPHGQQKPNQPKETLEAVLRKQDIPRSSAIYEEISARVSANHCTDLSFCEMRDTLQHWFPRGRLT